jgi:integrase
MGGEINVCAQNASPAALSPRNLAKVRIEFIRSSHNPRRSSSLIRFSDKSLLHLPIANYESRTYDRSLYDVGSGNIPGPTDPSPAGSRRRLLSESLRAVSDPEQRRKLCERWSFPTSTKLARSDRGILKSTTVHQEFRVLRRMLNVAVRKKLLAANPCSGVEFPVAVKGLFRPHYVTWSEQEQIESHGPEYLKNAVQIITETGLRVYKELTSMKKDQVDLPNAVVWIPDSKTPNGTAEVPLTPLAVEAFRRQMDITGDSLFGARRFGGRRFHTSASTIFAPPMPRGRLSAGGVADEWVTQMLRQGDAQVFKKYSQMKLQMKREALEKLNRRASEMAPTTGERMRTVMVQ